MQAADRDEKESGSLRSEGDLFLNGAEGHVQDPDSVFKAQDFYEHWTLEPADTDLIKNVSRNAGWQNIADLPSDLTDVNEEEEAEEEEEEDDDNAI
jgi:pectate lyase